jgi:hypothetical protein
MKMKIPPLPKCLAKHLRPLFQFHHHHPKHLSPSISIPFLENDLSESNGNEYWAQNRGHYSFWDLYFDARHPSTSAGSVISLNPRVDGEKIDIGTSCKSLSIGRYFEGTFLFFRSKKALERNLSSLFPTKNTNYNQTDTTSTKQYKANHLEKCSQKIVRPIDCVNLKFFRFTSTVGLFSSHTRFCVSSSYKTQG